MKERPILFNGDMVRAILEGRKTQTRRIVKPVGNDGGFVMRDDGDGWWPWRSDDGDSDFYIVKRNGGFYRDESPHTCHYGQPGDQLWVRETCIGEELDSGLDGVRYTADGAFHPIDDTQHAAIEWLKLHTYRGHSGNLIGPVVPSIHMPRWASRINLEITAVRVERLRDITGKDAVAEGIVHWEGHGYYDKAPDQDGNWHFKAEDAYKTLWESLNGPSSWDANPWVWCISFRRIK